MKNLAKFLLPILLFISLGLSFYFYNPFAEELLSTPSQKSIKKIVPKRKALDQKKPEQKALRKKTAVKPITKFQDITYRMQIDKSTVLHMEEKPKIVKKVKVKTKQNPKKNEVKTTKVIKLVNKSKKSANFEVSVKKYDNLKQMEKMYKKEKKYSLALKIGEEYFRKKKYSKALKWSKEANILNHKEEGAWLLYAKSEYAKGNKKRAIKLLKLYLGNAQSLEVESLLSEWLRKQR